MVGFHIPNRFVRFLSALGEQLTNTKNIGVFALSTITLGNELESKFFKVLGVVRCLPLHAFTL